MTKEHFITLLKKIEQSGIKFYDENTENFNSAWTVFSKTLTEEDLVEDRAEELMVLKSLSPREYFNTRHWINIEQQKLSAQPTCEGCGNKAYKVYKKIWDDKGQEILESVVSICNKCRVVDGEIISHKEIKEELKQHKDIIKDMVEDIIVEKAKSTLSYYKNK